MNEEIKKALSAPIGCWAQTLYDLTPAQVAAILAALEDSERLTYAEDNCVAWDAVSDPDNLSMVWTGTNPVRRCSGRSLRAAIDAARAAGGAA